MATQFQCIHFGKCERAGIPFTLKPGDPHECPLHEAKCREELVEVTGGSGKLKVVLIALPLAALLGLGIWYLAAGGKSASAGTAEQQLIEVWPWLKNTK